MAMRYPGGLIATSPVNAAYPSGVWTQTQTTPYVTQNVWQNDQYWPYTTLLLHGDGTNGAQNNTFLDSSSNNFSITRNGNTTQGAFTPFQQNGYWSNYFDGTANSYLRFTDTGSVLDLSGDFTVEFWAYQPAYATLNGTLNIFVSVDTLDRFQIFQESNGFKFSINGGVLITSSSVPALNTWNHFAITRSGSAVTMWINGLSAGTGTSSYSMACATMMIGGQDRGSVYNACNAYISNLRIVKGTALYSATFTPSTSPLTAVSGTSLLACQSNRFIDNSGNALAVATGTTQSVQAFQPFPGPTTWSASVLGGSGYFDGTGDYLTLGGQSAFVFGTGDFTIEMFAYVTNTANTIFDLRPSTPSGAYITIYMTGGVIYYYANGANQINGGTLPLNQWVHIVASRVSSNTRLFINGAQVGSTYSDTTNYTTSGSRPIIGADGNSTGSTPMIGYLSSLRVVKGSGVTSVTVPTSPLTNITNTSLLLNFTNAGIFDNAQMNDLETVGDAQISTSVVKYGTGSMAFDGSGDWLAGPPTPQTDLGSGDFTLEAWLYRTASGAASDSGIVSRGAPSTLNGFVFGYTSGNVLVFSFNYSGAIVTGVTVIPASTWTHVAVSRNGNTFRLFVNGVLDATATSTNSQTTNASDIFYVGRSGYDSGRIVTGYLDDVRITKGVARYISNFTPPIARMPNQ